MKRDNIFNAYQALRDIAFIPEFFPLTEEQKAELRVLAQLEDKYIWAQPVHSGDDVLHRILQANGTDAVQLSLICAVLSVEVSVK